MIRLLVLLIKAYQYWISPLRPPSCRFFPSCSCYMIEALSRHGLFKGLFMGIKRIVRCNPWSHGGYDPVP